MVSPSLRSRLHLQAMFIACVEGYPEPFEEPNYWTDEFRDFIGCCLQRNPKDRWSVAQLQQVRFPPRFRLSDYLSASIYQQKGFERGDG